MSNSSPIPVPITWTRSWISVFESTLLIRFFSELMIFPRSGRIAWFDLSRAFLGGAAGRVALDDEELGQLRVADLAVGELLRHLAAEGALAPRQVARLARCLAGVRGRDRLLDDLLRLGRVLLEELGELRVDGLLDEALDPRVAELRLRLALELRLAELDGDDRGEPLADVLALEVLLLLLEEVHVARVLVQRARERGVEAGEVRAALVRVDVVREREDRLDVLGVPLHRDLDLALLGLALEVDDVLVHGSLASFT